MLLATVSQSLAEYVHKLYMNSCYAGPAGPSRTSTYRGMFAVFASMARRTGEGEENYPLGRLGSTSRSAKSHGSDDSSELDLFSRDRAGQAGRSSSRNRVCDRCYLVRDGSCQCDTRCSRWPSRESVYSALSGMVIGAGLGAGTASLAYELSGRCSSTGSDPWRVASDVGSAIGRAASSASMGDYGSAAAEAARAFGAINSAGQRERSDGSADSPFTLPASIEAIGERDDANRPSWTNIPEWVASSEGHHPPHYQGSSPDLDRR